MVPPPVPLAASTPLWFGQKQRGNSPKRQRNNNKKSGKREEEGDEGNRELVKEMRQRWCKQQDNYTCNATSRQPGVLVMRFAAAPPSAPSSTATLPALSLSLSYRMLSCWDSHACENRAITYVCIYCMYIYILYIYIYKQYICE